MADGAGRSFLFRRYLLVTHSHTCTRTDRERHARLSEAFPRTGIGFFIAFVGLRNAKLVVANSATFVGLGNFADPEVQTACVGLALTLILMGRKINGGILIGIVGTALLGMLRGISSWPSAIVAMPHPSTTFMQLDLRGAIHLGFLEILFAFLFVDLFDNVGTLVGVCEQGGFIKDGKIPRVGRALLADATGTIFGSLAGTSTVTSYIESVAGIAVGARTGLSNVFVAALFVLAMFCSPLATAIPGYATAPALILVGALMTQSIAHVDWADFSEAVPAFITMLATPLTFSIATGLSLGLISYTVVKDRRGKNSRDQYPGLDSDRPVYPALHLPGCGLTPLSAEILKPPETRRLRNSKECHKPTAKFLPEFPVPASPGTRCNAASREPPPGVWR